MIMIMIKIKIKIMIKKTIFGTKRICHFQFRPRPPRLRESNGGQAEIENANQKIFTPLNSW